MDLIPGLPDDIARECLIRVPYDDFFAAASVCKEWKGVIENPKFLHDRKVAGCSRVLVAMAQARGDSTRKQGIGKSLTSPAYGLTLLEPQTGVWKELPSVPGFEDGLPMFCEFAAVGSYLIVMGGWDPKTWEASNLLFVYDFFSATWRRGADMPGGPRSFFGCGSDRVRKVYVAGGHDNEKNALKSVLAYDVAKDEWTQLPDMSRERDECKLVFRHGKIHVVGGYPTDMQGQFETSAEALDFVEQKWEPVNDHFLELATCPRTCVNGGDDKVYMCHDGYLVVQSDNAKWKRVAQLPADARSVAYVTTWHDKMLVIASSRYGEPHVFYALNLEDYTWSKLRVPKEFSGHVQSGCCLEI